MAVLETKRLISWILEEEGRVIVLKPFTQEMRDKAAALRKQGVTIGGQYVHGVGIFVPDVDMVDPITLLHEAGHQAVEESRDWAIGRDRKERRSTNFIRLLFGQSRSDTDKSLFLDEHEAWAFALTWANRLDRSLAQKMVDQIAELVEYMADPKVEVPTEWSYRWQETLKSNRFTLDFAEKAFGLIPTAK